MDTLYLVLKYLFYAVSIVAAFYFLLPTFLYIAYFLRGGLKNRRRKKSNDHSYHFAAIITAHQDERFIAPLVDSFLKQNYSNYTVYVVADDCDISGIQFNDDKIVMLRPPTPLHSKIKSIQYAIDHFKMEHDVMMIFDSDNLVHPTYFEKLNGYFQEGFEVVQTHMLSKNTDTVYSQLDSVGHIYYTFIERKSKMALGLSSSTLGLGIAIKYALYKEINYKNTVGGFDKKLQARMAMIVPQIAFADDVVVYDEKVEDAAVLEKQRTRWIYSYFSHFNDSWQLTMRGLKTFSMGRILLGLSMLRPPMIIQMALLAVLVVLSFFIKPVLVIAWAAVVFIFVLTFILIVATQSYQKGMLQSLRFIPLLIVSQFKSLLKMKQAKNNFLKTEHQKVMYIDELLKHERS